MTVFTFRDIGFVSGRRLLYPNYVQVLLDRIKAADELAGNTQGLELGVTDAISTCVQALKNDGILGVTGATPEVQVLSQSASLIKASCFMMGARTLSGALVPLAADMPAPTNFNFSSPRYNRRTGLIGDGATTYLDSNRADSGDPQNSAHLSVYATTPSTTGNNTYSAYAGTGNNINSFRVIYRYNAFVGAGGVSAVSVYNRSAARLDTGGMDSTGLIATNRANGSQITGRAAQLNFGPLSTTSNAPSSSTIFIFAENANGIPTARTNARLNFYSIGESLDLAILDARITALSNAIQAAIAP